MTQSNYQCYRKRQRSNVIRIDGPLRSEAWLVGYTAASGCHFGAIGFPMGNLRQKVFISEISHECAACLSSNTPSAVSGTSWINRQLEDQYQKEAYQNHSREGNVVTANFIR
jgi:hypothetical protein